MSEHKFSYKWYLKDGYPAKGIEPNGCKVFGTFICGGGSSMGYKLAGYTHLGGVEIDPKVAAVYKANHDPKYLFVEDIRLFNQRQDLPAELFDLDFLDGSPPCSSFSTAGNRDKDWGKKKQFREGQELQRLDDLVFEYIKTIGKLRPKVALLENVKGLIIGNAKAYAKQMKTDFEALGYKVQVFLLNAASMGVPQKRERVFFIGVRDDFKVPELKLRFDERPIFISDVNAGYLKMKTFYNMFSGMVKDGSSPIYLCSKAVSKTITGTDNDIDVFEEIREGQFLNGVKYSKSDLVQIGSYPLDYEFESLKPKYLIGMSVPPVMTAQIAHQIWLQWLSKIKTG